MGSTDKDHQRILIEKLTISLAKSEFCHATLTVLGHVVGQGQVKPLEARVKTISDSCTYRQKTADAISWYGWSLQKVL